FFLFVGCFIEKIITNEIKKRGSRMIFITRLPDLKSFVFGPKLLHQHIKKMLSTASPPPRTAA
ncbi:MAG TPA: hypothetical protein PL000_20560, partial [Anaerolineales bacterium]|nr:hypothetical protein [Anaerolineales bacterium]